MMTYLHELVEYLTERMSAWATCVSSMRAGEHMPEVTPLAVWMEMEGWRAELVRVCALALPELADPNHGKAPAAPPAGTNGAAAVLPERRGRAAGDQGQEGTTDVDPRPTFGIPVREALAANPSQTTFVVPSAYLSVHLEKLDDGRALIELAVCDQERSPLFVFWPELAEGNTFYVGLARVDVHVSLGPDRQEGNTRRD